MKKFAQYLLEICLILFLLTIVPYFMFGHNEPYEIIPIGCTGFCAFRHDSEYYKLCVYEEEENHPGTHVLGDFLQSVMYKEDVIVARCAINRDFFVRYYFITYDISNSENYFVSGPISEQACLDSLSARNMEPSKMEIVNYKNYDNNYLP